MERPGPRHFDGIVPAGSFLPWVPSADLHAYYK
jgi:hypothetical protein